MVANSMAIRSGFIA